MTVLGYVVAISRFLIRGILARLGPGIFRAPSTAASASTVKHVSTAAADRYAEIQPSATAASAKVSV